MRIVTKRSKIIVMTQEEVDSFLQCVQEAAEGRTVHASERKLADGSYLGVNVLTPEQEEEQRRHDAKREQAAHEQRERDRYRPMDR